MKINTDNENIQRLINNLIGQLIVTIMSLQFTYFVLS